MRWKRDGRQKRRQFLQEFWRSSRSKILHSQTNDASHPEGGNPLRNYPYIYGKFQDGNCFPSLRVSLGERLQSSAKRGLSIVLDLPCQSVFLRQHQHPVIAAGHEPQRNLAQGEVGVVNFLCDDRGG